MVDIRYYALQHLVPEVLLCKPLSTKDTAGPLAVHDEITVAVDEGILRRAVGQLRSLLNKRNNKNDE